MRQIALHKGEVLGAENVQPGDTLTFSNGEVVLVADVIEEDATMIGTAFEEGPEVMGRWDSFRHWLALKIAPWLDDEVDW